MKNPFQKSLKKAGFGGGCHWCTEAVFLTLTGVKLVQQGYIASTGKATGFSEAVLIEYDPETISLETLIEIHLRTHEATSHHSFRDKYRSAIYFLENESRLSAQEALQRLQKDFNLPLITQVLPFSEFKESRESLQNYYYSNPEKPFCKRFIEPKIQLLLKQFRKEVNPKWQ